MTKITIITVVKNNLVGIRKTIKSIRAQSFLNYEHIIIDSNSNDGTSEFLKDNLNKKTVYLREEDSGIYHAINKGITISTGKYIGLLHSGDFFYSKNTLMNISQNLSNFDYIFGDLVYYKKKNINRIWKFKENNFYKPNPFIIPHTTLFIKKHIIVNLDFYEKNLKISSDTDFLIKLCRKNFKYKKLNKFLVFMQSGGVSFSILNLSKKFMEDIKVLKKYYKIFFILVYFYKVLIKMNGYIFLNFNKEIKYLNTKFQKTLIELENLN